MKYAEFPKSEYENRCAKIQQRMGEEDIDAVLVTSEENFRYITGFYTEYWINLSRPMACWIPKEGEPILIMADIEEYDARETSWIENIQCFSEWSSSGPEIFGLPQVEMGPAVQKLLINSGRSLDLGSAKKIGIEYGSQMRWGMPLQIYDGLKEAFSNTEWVDATGILWEARLVKSKLELDYTRQAVEVLNKAFPALFQEITIGMTEIDVIRIFRKHMISNGADRLGYTHVSADISKTIFGSPRPKQLTQGNMIYVDGGCFYKGYCADYCRLASIGKATDSQKRAYELLIDSMDAAIAAANPGATTSDVARAIQIAFEKGDAKAGGFGRFGHGNGLEMPEPPNIQEIDKTVLKPGMVICLEPNIFIPDVGYLVGEEQIAITEEGCEVLSNRATKDLMCILETT